MVNELRNQHVGLIGANGFIGSATLRALLRVGVTPRALCGPDTRPFSTSSGIDALVCDLTDADQLEPWVSGLDVIVLAAGPPSVRASFEMPEEYVRVHVQGTAAVLHACQKMNVRRLVYISSAEVYGRPVANPVGEGHRLQARSPYAAAKIGAEKLIEAYADSYGLSAVVLRPFSIYGPNPTPESLLANIITMAKRGCVTLANLKPVRDYCYVEDLASAVLLSASLLSDKLQIFNIGTGKGTSVADLAKLVLHLMDAHVPLLEDNGHMRPGESEIFELVADVSRARTVLGWQPDVDLEQGLRQVLRPLPGQT
jgi:nucleoside-diphosphate-sugar epimerase